MTNLISWWEQNKKDNTPKYINYFINIFKLQK